MNLGKILGLSKSNHIILRSVDWQSIKEHPAIGDGAFTIEKRKIGLIHDIFGPVTKPYISIKLYNTNTENLEQIGNEKGSFMYTFKELKKKKRPPRSRGPPQKRGFRRISPN